MSEEITPHELEIKIARAETFYARLRRKTERWLERHRIGWALREYLLLLPDLFMLVIRLLRDPRVGAKLKLQLLGATAYVIAPIDFVPDMLVPVGLTDDTVALAFILARVVGMLGEAGDGIVREHWEGRGEVLAQIRAVLNTADLVLNRRIVGWLAKRFGHSRASQAERLERG